VKGAGQFWSQAGVETILALRALWLSQDDRWNRYWSTRPAHQRAVPKVSCTREPLPR